MANWITLADLNGEPRLLNADLVFMIYRDMDKTVLTTIGERIFQTHETVADVVKLMAGSA